MVFAPAGVGCKASADDSWPVTRERARFYDAASASRPSVAAFGHGYLLVRSRLRITRDGGESVLAVQVLQPFTDNQRSRVNRVIDAHRPPNPQADSASASAPSLTDMFARWRLGVHERAVAVGTPASPSVPALAPLSQKAALMRFNPLLTYLEKAPGLHLLSSLDELLRELHSEDPFNGQTIEDHVDHAYRFLLIRKDEEGEHTWVNLGRFGPLVLAMQDLMRSGIKRPSRSVVLQKLAERGASYTVGDKPPQFFRSAEKLGLIQREDDIVTMLPLKEPLKR
jgi:hypothetical protein